MKTYKIRSSAVRAAKKEFGDNWLDFVSINEVDGEFQYEMRAQAEIDDLQKLIKTIAVVQDLADNQAEIDQKASKKAEIESRKPRHIPSTPLTSIVKEESAPIPDPIPSPSEKIASPAESIVPPSLISDAAEAIDQFGEDELERFAAEADKKANLEAVNKNSAKPRLSSAEKPTKLVWHVADGMLIAAQKAGLPMPKRKDVIEECVRRGIAYGTSRTQYQHWFKCYNDSIGAPIATIGKDGKIVPPTK